MEKFLLANTQELSKDKWLCPLSGKKFKVSQNGTSFFISKTCPVQLLNHRSFVVCVFVVQAPEFVRKHILNKHIDKVTAVRQEVDFFNNFLLDTKRPSLPENKPLLPAPPGQTHVHKHTLADN